MTHVDDDTPWFVYLVLCADGSLYCGVSNDVARRFDAHARGVGARYTRGRGPLRLVFVDERANRRDALVAEAALKRLPRARKLAIAAFANESDVDVGVDGEAAAG